MKNYHTIGFIAIVVVLGMFVVPTMAIPVDPPPNPPPSTTITHTDYAPFVNGADGLLEGTVHNSNPWSGSKDLTLSLKSDLWQWSSNTYDSGYLWVSTDLNLDWALFSSPIYDPFTGRFIVFYSYASVKVDLYYHVHNYQGAHGVRHVATLFFMETPDDRGSLIWGSKSISLYTRYYVGPTVSNYFMHQLEIRVSLHTNSWAQSNIDLDCDAFKFYITNPN